MVQTSPVIHTTYKPHKVKDNPIPLPAYLQSGHLFIHHGDTVYNVLDKVWGELLPPQKLRVG